MLRERTWIIIIFIQYSTHTSHLSVWVATTWSWPIYNKKIGNLIGIETPTTHIKNKQWIIFLTIKTGPLILRNGAISHNWPQIASDRTIEEKRIIPKKKSKFKQSKWWILPLNKALQDIRNLWLRYLGSHFDFRDKQGGQLNTLSHHLFNIFLEVWVQNLCSERGNS